MTMEPLLTPEEVATFLRKSRSWVYQAAADKKLPSTRVGRDLRFKRSELESWLNANTSSTAPAALKDEG